MITNQLFLAKMNLLMEHFDKQLQPEVVAMWKEELDESLENDEFVEATRQLVLYFEPRFKGHFPTVKALLDTVGGSKEIKALQEWQSVLSAARSNNTEVINSLSWRAKVALQALGGLSIVGQSDERRTDFLKKDFVNVYLQSGKRDRKSLPPAQTLKNPEHEPSQMPEYIKNQMQDLASKMRF